MASRHVSVDFGGTSLRAVEFSTDKKGALTVHRTAQVNLPIGTILRGKVEDPGTLAHTLKTLWTEGKFKSKDVVFGVSNSAVVVRRVEVPWQPPTYFRQSLRYSLPEGTLMDDVDYQVDFHPLDEFVATAADGTQHRRSQIFLVAAETTMIEGFLGPIKAAGLRPFKIDHLAFALTRFAAQDGFPGVELLVDIGAHSTHLVLQQDGQPLFTRYIAKGGDATVSELMAQFQWDRKTAEDAVKVLGVSTALALVPVHTAFGVDPIAEQPDVHPAQPIIDKYAAEYINEIRTSVDWFLQNATNVHSVDRVIFSGGGSLITGMRDRIASELHIPVKIAEPFANVTGKNAGGHAEEAPRWTMAVGLATGVK